MTAHDVSTCMRIAYRLCERHGWHGQWADVWRGLYYLRDPGWSWPGCSVTDDDGAPKVTLAHVVQLAVAALEETPADEKGADGMTAQDITECLADAVRYCREDFEEISETFYGSVHVI